MNSYTQDKISNFYQEENVPEAFMKSQNKVVKHLYDSEYVKPTENFRVVQDSNPVKAAIMNQALHRYEQDIQKNSKMHSDYVD